MECARLHSRQDTPVNGHLQGLAHDAMGVLNGVGGGGHGVGVFTVLSRHRQGREQVMQSANESGETGRRGSTWKDLFMARRVSSSEVE